jgi:hypothetical protein
LRQSPLPSGSVAGRNQDRRLGVLRASQSLTIEITERLRGLSVQAFRAPEVTSDNLGGAPSHHVGIIL